MNVRPWIAALALLAVPPAGPARAADAVLPDTPAGRIAAAWFEAFNGSEADMRRMLENHFARASNLPVEERLGRWRTMRDEIGRLTPVRALGADASSVATLCRDGHDGWVRVTVELNQETPPRVARVAFDQAETGELEGAAGAQGGAGAAATPLSEEQLVDSLVRHVEALARDDRFAGVVRVERLGRVVLERAWGEADRAKHVPNRADTRFNLGSINKQFTKAVIAKLVEQGRISPDDRLVKFLPDFPREKAEKITIQQLLDMRSGLGDVFGPRYQAADKSKLRNPRDWFPLFVDDTLLFEPGTRERYSNAGYEVLGAVAEAVTGRSYFDLVRDWVYRPAGMESSDSFGKDEPVPDRAIGYTRQRGGGHAADPGPPRPSTDGQPWRGSPAGGGYSTARDLSRYLGALAGGRILKPESVERFYGGGRRADGTLDLGFAIAGGSPGVNTDVEVDGEWTVIVLANLDPPAASGVARHARDWTRRVK